MPSKVTYGMVEEFANHLRTTTDDRKANSEATVNQRLRYLKAAFRAGVWRGYLKVNPMEGYSIPRSPERMPYIVSDTEEAALLEAGERLYGFDTWAFIYVALRTGGRRGELLTLSWADVDVDRGTVTFKETKGKRDRIVPVNADVVDVLRKLQSDTLRTGPFVGMTVENIRSRWESIREDVGIPGVRIHDLRKTYTTRLIRAGVPLPTVQKLCGHADISTTVRHYNLVSDDDKRAAVAKLLTA